MAVTFKTSGRNPTEAALKAFEVDNALSLPLDYRDFLGSHNGGCPSPNACWVDDIGDFVLVDELYGIARDDASDLQFWIEEYGDEMPEGSVIVGGDPGGAMFILGTTVDFSGIYFWDHQHWYAGSSEENGNTFFIAETFSTWIQTLQELPRESTGKDPEQDVTPNA
jgi:hypothetical protein